MGCAMSDLIQLIYASSTDHMLTETELLEILEVSRKNNRERDITGILLYKSGNFLQVLEGPKDVVLALYAVIEADPRHREIMKVSERPITERDFPEWQMAFVNLNNVRPEDVPAYSEYLNSPFDVQTFAGKPSLAYTFVSVFKEGMR